MTRPLALEFTTQLVVQEQWNGTVTMFPAADPKLACYGASFQDCLSQQRSFLTRYLAVVPAEVLAGFSFPAGATLHETEIQVAREDLPLRDRVVPVVVEASAAWQRMTAKARTEAVILPSA